MMDGIIIVNKELGYTSRDIVNIVGKKLGTKKVGHTGTLDPMASGVLVICVGKALKICELLTNHDKEYIAGVLLGIETDTLDMEGSIIRQKKVNIDKQKIIETVNSFKKEYFQEVPKYSAVKVNGKKLYEYARNNIDVALPSKKVSIKNISVIDDEVNFNEGKTDFKIKCCVSKGTYIRSLVRDIGRELGCPAVMSSLVRTRQGIFTLDQASSLNDIKNDNFKIISITEALPNIKKITVTDDVSRKVRNGVRIKNLFDDEMAFIFDTDDNLLALYQRDGDECRVYKMFV